MFPTSFRLRSDLAELRERLNNPEVRDASGPDRKVRSPKTEQTVSQLTTRSQMIRH